MYLPKGKTKKTEETKNGRENKMGGKRTQGRKTGQTGMGRH
jgi:hypothetical protein